MSNASINWTDVPNTRDVEVDVVENYLDVSDAATFCGMSKAGFEAHLYKIKDIKPSQIFGKKLLLFHKNDLRQFMQRVRPANRPRKGQESNRPKFTEDEWIALCKAHDNKCAACGKATKLHVDHIVPRIKGGADTIDNIQPLCKSCNAKKGTRIIDYRKNGK